MNIFNELTPQGRLTRSEFLKKFFTNIIFYVVASVIYHCFTAAYAEGLVNPNHRLHGLLVDIFILTTIAMVALNIWLFYPLICKRLHDIGRSSSTYWIASTLFTISVITFTLFANSDDIAPIVGNLFGQRCSITGPQIENSIYINVIITAIGAGALMIWYIILIFFLDSQRGENKYGKSKKHPDSLPITPKTQTSPSSVFNLITYATLAVLTLLHFLTSKITSEETFFYLSYLFVYGIIITCSIRAYKNGHSLFSFFGILTIVNSCWTLNLILGYYYHIGLHTVTLCIYFIACTALAFYSTGVLRKELHTKRPLWHVIMVLIATVICLALQDSWILLCILFIYCIKFIYEYLQKHHFSKTKSVTIATIIPLGLMCLREYTLTQYFKEEGTYIPNMPFIISILLISCIVFTPKSPLNTEIKCLPSTQATQRTHIICCIVTAVLYILSILLDKTWGVIIHQF